MMDRPYWYKLLDYWVNKNDNSGLTVPFLIGVKYDYLNGAVPGQEPVSKLFNEIMNGPAFEYCTTVEFCRTINAYRLGLTGRQDLVTPYFNNEHGEATLAFKQTEFGDHDQSAMIRYMISKYGDLIASGNFSKGSSAFGIWEPFTTKDRLFIEKALK